MSFRSSSAACWVKPIISFICLCCDGAAWHKAGSLCVPKNMELFFIPPYTPEMNPIEQIWKELDDYDYGDENAMDEPEDGEDE